MALAVQQGSFLSPTSASTDTTLELDFAPAALLLWGTPHGTAGTTESHASFTFGAVSGTSAQRAGQVISALVATGGTIANVRCSNTILGCLRLGASSTASYRVAACTTFGASTVLDWSSIGDVNQDYFHYLALGGTGVEAKVGSVQLGASDSTTAVTGVGFAPDALLCWVTTTTTSDPYATTSGSSRWCLGWATPDAQGCSSVVHVDDANPTMTARRQTTGHCLWTGTVTDDYLKANVSAWGADGFSIYVTTAFASNYYVHYLALKGVSASVGTLTQPTSTGQQATTTTGVAPKALLLTSVGGVSSSSVQDDARFSFGVATSPTVRTAVSWGDEDDRDIPSVGSNAYTYMSQSHVLRLMQEGSPMTDLASADFVAFNAEGFTLDWESADATAREVLYLALGDETGTAELTAYCQEIEGDAN